MEIANFIITSGEIFNEDTKYENWVQGSKYVVNDINNKDIRGEYDLLPIKVQMDN
jgi:hypothetical protein